ncbi:hypothetical protein O181_013316 [Austropuccinia psidii MF-1]|uniref:Uncharacterized protein n=1 Tax=Austropuccinia psidii MF-1 TaxID=1389203 RepID=A0A9Q3BZG5_9BASI|nr:hypothetical protein [Austropuccinia psidii MF-1]
MASATKKGKVVTPIDINGARDNIENITMLNASPRRASSAVDTGRISEGFDQSTVHISFLKEMFSSPHFNFLSKP